MKAVSDNGDPAMAAAVLTKELGSGTPTMVWPGSVSADSAAMIPILAKRDVFAITLVDGRAQCATDAATNVRTSGPLANPTVVSRAGRRRLDEGKRFTKVGLLESDTAQSAAQTPHFRKLAAQAGMQVKGASFPSSAVDLVPQLQSLKQSGAEIVYGLGIGAAQYALTARAKLSWDVPVIFDTSASSLDLTSSPPPRTSRTRSRSHCTGRMRGSRTRAWRRSSSGPVGTRRSPGCPCR